jgi:WD40 repeat protein
VFSPDSKLMAYYGLDGNVHLLNMATRQSVTLPSPEPSDQALTDSLAFSPDGRTLAAGTGDGKIGLWDTRSGQLLATLADPADASPRQDLAGVSEVWALAFGEDGKLLAAGDANGNVYLWNVARQRVIGALAGAPSAFNGSALQVAFSPDGGLIAVSFEDGTVRVWSAASGRRLADFDGNIGAAGPIAFALGGKALMVLEGFGEATEWDLKASRS